MKTKNYLILSILMVMTALRVQASDWVLNESKYWAYQSGDHLRLEVFLADLDRSNTYSAGGYVYATNGSRTIDLVYLEYINDGDDEAVEAKVKAYLYDKDTRAWFADPCGSSQITSSNTTFWLRKWGSDHHYMTAYIDFYFPASMANSTWQIAYRFKHNNGSWYTMKLCSSISVEGSLGLSAIDASKYTCKMNSPSNINFTAPQLPDDIPNKVNDVRSRICSYDVSYIYTKQDGTTVTQRNTFDCDKNMAKSYDTTIPDEVGNPRQIDLRITARQGVKDASGNYYWSTTGSYNKNAAFETVPVPGTVTPEYRQFDKSADLAWSSPTGSNYLKCTPYIYRIETDANGKIPSGNSWNKRGTITNTGSNTSLTFTDNNVAQATYYKYLVLNVPNDWVNKGVSSASLNSPDDALLAKLGHSITGVMSTAPTMSVYDLQQDTTVTDVVKLTWQYSRVPTDAASVNFKVLRKTSEDGQWKEYDNVNGDADPSAGTLLSFTDRNLPVNARYQYKVRLSLLNDKYQFDSDAITAGLLEGSSVKSFSATKGTHENTVRLSWNAKQVGSANTTYVLSRRYVNSSDEFIRINTTNGNTEQFTYEDNTVQPGYYYEYRCEVYNGDMLQNTLYDVGFCQARGVISGRVTFGTGSSVDDVRMTLRASETNDNNAVRGHSQRVDGASTGIAWDADKTELAKVFGSDKDYTVQMFVRPDEGMNEGAIIGEIPGEGRLAVGSQTTDGYELLWEKIEEPTVVDLSSLKGDYTANTNEVLTGKLGGKYKISIADGASVTLKDVTINGDKGYSYKWAGITCRGDATIWLEGNNTVKGFYDEYPGIYIPSGKTLTIRGSGSLTASSNGSAAGIGGGYEIDCGNIVILGGTIKATGGSQAAGIGGGYYGDCGNITISKGVTEVFAEFSFVGMFCIGRGMNGTGGKVTIGGKETTGINAGDYTYTGDGSGSVSGEPFRYVSTSTGLNLTSNMYSLLSVSREGNQLGIQVDNGETKTQTAANTPYLKPFSVGGATDVTEYNAFMGNLSEVRVWNHALTDAEMSSYADRMLNGREQGLALYWPMDEGLDRYVFDASYANDLPNGRHATVGNNILASNIIPADNQLSRYATTNSNGEYIIRGIPFVGSGSTYTLTPTRGIHEFNPTSRNGFIGSGSLTLNAYDFTDVSSFPVKGKITYLNTNIPADSIQFKIDGALVQDKDGVRMTDANGEYEISVPIGNHLIEAYKNGHRLTSFPLDGSTYDFKKAEVVNFVDSTLVNVTGRINGGFSDQNAPLGFKQSVNRLGKATIKLSLGKEDECSFNYITDERGNRDYGKVDIPVESATDSIKSTAYRPALKKNNSDTYYICITTDEKTGEFSALLPPLKYKVESITFDNDENGNIYNNLSVFSQNLPIIDATNTVKEKMRVDSINVDGLVTQKYEYSAKMLRQYRANPQISVFQKSPLLAKKEKDKPVRYLFGESKIAISNVDQTVDSVAIITQNGDNYTYNFGYPLYQQDREYQYDIDISETYVNLDTKETFTEIPRDAVIHIANDASSTTTVFAERGTINGEVVELGQPYETHIIDITPDENGHVDYAFVAGWPNFASSHLVNWSVAATVDGRTTLWQAPDSKTDALDMIVLGSIGSGTNFVTKGPDTVDKIIRRPPGSTSVATITDKSIRSYSHTTVDTNGEGDSGGVYLSETPTWELTTGTVLGVAILTKSKFKVVLNQKIVTTNKYSDTDVETNDTTYNVTDAMSTPNSMQIDYATMTYTPEGGDTYIGRSTNLLFSNGRILGLFKQKDGSYKIEDKNGVTVGQQFGTTFVFPQAYIINSLIPNWQAVVKSKLEEGFIAADHTNPDNCPKRPGKVIYYTKYKPGDPAFGKLNTDFSFWTKEQIAAAGGCPSYRMVNGTDEYVDDEIQSALHDIQMWQERIADNEKDKLEAFGDASNLIDNFSIASGTKITHTDEQSVKNVKSSKHDTSYLLTVDANSGVMLNDAGTYLICGVQNFDNHTTTNDTTRTHTTTVTWTMSDSDPRTALSVDVYKSPKGWGPIFRTRGGQTVNPYESGSATLFYQPGTALSTATMKVENPQLKVIGSSEITDVPTGGQAQFKLELSNQSETNDICTYVLEAKDSKNPTGAILMMDGTPLSNGKQGRTIKMTGGETVVKTLFVSQSDRSITDYDDIVLQLKSENDFTILSDDVKLRVHFVPASAYVDLAVNHTVLNKALYDDDGGITAKMQNLDRQDEGLQGLRLRYRRKGTDSWTLVKQWTTVESLLGQGYEPLPDGSQLSEKVTFLDDGIYELQAQTFGLYGTEEVTYESNIIEVTQDTHGPKILGMVSPENGELTYLNRGNMHLRFNEVLNGNALSKSDNFRIEGGMNNVVFGESPYPDVAAQLNGNAIETDAFYDLSQSDYAFDLWFYRQGDGTIISLGTEDNLLALATHDGGKLRARIGGENDVFDTQTQLPENKWIYLAMDYKHKSTSDAQNRITMLYVTADDKQPNYICKNLSATDLDGHGKLAIGGDDMQGMIAGLSIWNNNVTAEELYETRNQQRASYTPGLVGYWKMDEGHGTQLTDHARSRHMYMENESWYINNENRAAHLDGTEGSPLKVDIATFNPAKTDNLAYEMWFRGNEADNTQEATLLSVGNGSSADSDMKTIIGFDEKKLKLKLVEDLKEGNSISTIIYSDVALSDQNYLDGNWHHLALNVRRGTSAVVYVDGQAVKVLPEASVPGISSHYLMVGGELIGESEANRFTGDVDEIRIWSAALDGQLISERMYERMDNSYPGLVGYFPMEDIHRTQQGNVVTDFSAANFGETGSKVKIANATLKQAVNAPALKPGSTKMRLDDSQFNFTASADEIYFSFPDAVLPLMDNNDFVASVNYIKDEHGNNSESVTWKFHTDFASVSWLALGVITEHVEKAWNETTSFIQYVYNKTGIPQFYEISGLPTWMSVDKPTGFVNDNLETVNFTVSSNAPVGRHTEHIYLTDRLGIRRVLQVNVTVEGDAPNWSISNPDMYESNMTLTGQVYIGDKIGEYEETMVAAFNDMNQCVGIGKPRYVSTRDAYFIDMIIYGAAPTDLSTGESRLTFHMYDASTGVTYPIIELTMPNGTKTRELTYTPDALIGTYDNPVVFRTTNDLLQTVSLPRGWTWMSMYVQPESTAIADILPKKSSDLLKYQYVKGKTAFTSAYKDSDGQAALNGTLEEMQPGQMYKIQVSAATALDLYGKVIDVTQQTQTIRSGYNWIGTMSSSVMSPNEAFADLQPEVGDMVKGRRAYAVYGSRGTWEGLLESIVPGEGYVYQSKATETKTFHYPRTRQTSNRAPLYQRRAMSEPSHFLPEDDSQFPDNMIMIAAVEKDGERVEDAEVGAFINGECRGAVTCKNGYYFLTIMGSSEEDKDATIELRVWHEGEEYVIENEKHFVSEAAYGTLDEPYLLDLNNSTGIHMIALDGDDSDWYTLQGFKIGHKPTQPGVYIHQGKKVSIKRAK